MNDFNVQIVDPFHLAKEMDFGNIHLKYDSASGLKAIIAIHNTNLGPSLGGCRFSSYSSTSEAIYDAMRLAKGMSYKAAISGLPLGGGKAVIIKPEIIKDREALFVAFGRFVNELSGNYITAVDSGTNVTDMDVIARQTNHVRSTSKAIHYAGDPSPFTAHGVTRAIQAAVKEKFGSSDLSGVHVVIQGVGHVGYFLAKELFNAGARLTYSDLDEAALNKVRDEFAGDKVDVNNVYDVECDVFAPCALGGAINSDTVSRLRTQIVAGAANNQLATANMAEVMQKKKILYVPDYVANAGGLIQVALKNKSDIKHKISNIYTTLTSIFAEANNMNRTTAETTDIMAKKIILEAGTMHAH